MLKVAVISDVHANLEALEAVLAEVRGLDLYCLGDLVDYGADPNEVVELVRERKVRAVLGNHDRAALQGDVSMFNAWAAISSKWTARTLSEDSSIFLRGLPLNLRLDLDGIRGFFVHGSPDDPLWEYVSPTTHHLLFGHYLAKVDSRLVGMGHTHVPYVWAEEAGTVFNPGSVGQPRDGDPRASFAILSVVRGMLEVEVRRAEYNREKAASKIRKAGLPEFFAERLSTGT